MKIIIGKSKTGKSTKIYELIDEDISKGINPILFVPSQTREIAEIEYMKNSNKNGIIGVNITTINEYIRLVLKKKNLHLEDNYISKLDKKLIVSNVINENKDKLKLFKNVRNKDGFLELINIYIDIFSKNNINEENIKSINIKNVLLKEKIDEIYYIFSKYQEKISGKYIDSISEIDLFTNNISMYENELKNTAIYFDGYNNFTKKELDFIKSILKLNIDVTIAINTDITCIEDIYSGNTNDIFEVSNKTYASLLSIANSLKNQSVENIILYNNNSGINENILYLADNIFEPVKNSINLKDDSVSINIYSNLYKEIESVAYNICKKRKEGYRYNDFCIYTTDIDSYESVISRVFYEYGIPVYADTKRKIQVSRLTEYILELMDMASKDINLESVITILKKGLNNFNLDDLSYLENYILEFNINKYNVKNKLYLNNEKYNENIYDLDKINEIRDNAVNIFSEVVKKLKLANNTKEIVSIIYEHLVSNNVFENYYNLSQNIEDKTYFLYSSKADFKIWEKISEVFDSIDKIYNKEKINIEEYYKLFKMVISEIYIKSVPPTKDKVILADINVSKVDMKKISFFVGVTDGKFPKKHNEDVLFSDYELEELNKHQIDFKETSISKENMEKYNIYEAINNTKEKLFISMPAVDIKNETTRKSSLIKDIEKLLSIKMLGEVTENNDLKIKYNDIYSKEKCFEYMAKKIRYINSLIDNLDKVDDIQALNKQIIEILSIYEYFKNDEKYKCVINYIKRDDNLNEESIDRIYKEEFKSSVYKLEQFKKCPFAYYMKYVLNINKRKVYEITSMDTGSLMHNVIDEFPKYLILNKINFKDIINEEEILLEEYKFEVIKIIEELLKNEFKKQKESVKYGIYKRKLENTMLKIIAIIAKSFKQSDFEIFGNEIEFNDNSIYLPIVLKLDNNTNMKIIGKIDRVDILNENNKSYLRIIDYKSSYKTLTIDKIKEGISLQLITYMTAMLENISKEKQVLPSACLYFNLSDKLINLKDYTKNEEEIKKEFIKKLRMNGIFLKNIEILKSMDKYVEDTSNKLIDITPNRMSNSKKVLEDEEFLELCEESKKILKSIGNEMIKGVVKIEKCNKEACKFCDFSSICRKESSL